ncbi:MAG: right-handed parallel beta-helix repeat-containing protein [Limnochordia bacterium]
MRIWIRRVLLVVLVLAVVFPMDAVASVAGYRNPEMAAAAIAGQVDEANVLWWGFAPDDSTEYLQAAINSGVSRLIVPNVGQDWIIRPVFLRSNLEIIFEDGVVVTAKKGEFHGRNDSLFTGQDVENVVIRGYGATLRMHKQDYDDPAKYEKAEWRMGIAIRGSRNVQIYGLTIKDTGGDGIYLGRGSRMIENENVVIKDIVTDNCYRQGISVISARNLLIENSVFKDTGGTPPGAGIDLEPNRPDEKLVNIIIRNNVFDNNVLGMHMYLNYLDASSDEVYILWENNIVRGGNVGINLRWLERSDPRGTIVFKGCVVEDSKQVGIRVGSVPSRNLNVRFEDCFLRNSALDVNYSISGRNTAPVALIIHEDDSEHGRGQVKFKNVVISDRFERPILIGAGPNVRTSGDVPDVVGEIDAYSPYGVWYEWEGPSKQAALDFTVIPDPTEAFYENMLARFEQAKAAASESAFVWPVFQFDDAVYVSRVRGVLDAGIRLMHVDEEDLESIEILLDDEPVYRGSSMPETGRVTIDTRALADGRHTLTAVAAIRDGYLDEVRTSVGFVTQNFWQLDDLLDAPMETGWFGTLDLSKTVDESAGWQYATGDEDVFFGDGSRKARRANTTEYLVWETPLLGDFSLTLYGQDREMESIVELAVSADGLDWQPLTYTVAQTGRSAQGWFRLVLSGDASESADTRFFKVTLKESAAPTEIQLGEVHLAGMNPE